MPLIQVGDEAPSFAMTNHASEAVALDDFAGKYVLLWWYPKAGTPG